MSSFRIIRMKGNYESSRNIVKKDWKNGKGKIGKRRIFYWIPKIFLYKYIEKNWLCPKLDSSFC